ncbi:hypothetical protein MLD38_028208 [Melastoma candidum]|uniref:Uncharacterized protein n=1 Tax=Melastoma candidum TaxID=119954 RepID=A0ACB9N0G1_9MYRT|nr:hypothetical protein MLD38_028208 [Melastoma candidum]
MAPNSVRFPLFPCMSAISAESVMMTGEWRVEAVVAPSTNFYVIDNSSHLVDFVLFKLGSKIFSGRSCSTHAIRSRDELFLCLTMNPFNILFPNCVNTGRVQMETIRGWAVFGILSCLLARIWTKCLVSSTLLCALERETEGTGCTAWNYGSDCLFGKGERRKCYTSPEDFNIAIANQVSWEQQPTPRRLQPKVMDAQRAKDLRDVYPIDSTVLKSTLSSCPISQLWPLRLIRACCGHIT